MTGWRQWLKSLLERVRASASPDTEGHGRSTEARDRFWEEFRAGQRVADERMIAAADREGRD